ncbi:hypothetical protein [Virgibacillus siamensis]|uniref:hypothetical protein n=1 Tax=Virgibacillus siamensis TaxID=480071 RepID=UPI00158BA2CA|nr:hypothetical protein [Virgibacillus siamensis]
MPPKEKHFALKKLPLPPKEKRFALKELPPQTTYTLKKPDSSFTPSGFHHSSY